MSLELRQQLKLSQQLVMTPQLQQAIKLLQMSRLDLVEAVHQELLENPFLEEAAEQPTQDEKRQADGADDRSKGKDEDQVYDGETSPALPGTTSSASSRKRRTCPPRRATPRSRLSPGTCSGSSTSPPSSPTR